MKNNVTFKAIGGTVLVLALSILVFVFVNALVPFRHMGPRIDEMPPPPDIFLFQIIVLFVMLALSIYLFFIYLKDYLQLKSKFTFGLLLAILSFMLFAIAANPVLHVFFGIYGSRGIFSLVPYGFATISLAILAWVSSK